MLAFSFYAKRGVLAKPEFNHFHNKSLTEPSAPVSFNLNLIFSSTNDLFKETRNLLMYLDRIRMWVTVRIDIVQIQMVQFFYA